MTHDLPDGTAVVTGGSGGLGAAIVAGLAEEGVAVTTVDRAETPPAGSALHVCCDVADAAVVGEGVARAERELGPASMLVCAAGVTAQFPYDELDEAEWRRVVDASLTGVYVATRALVPGMAARGSGAVLAISSGLATRGQAGGGHYAAAKAGVEALLKSLALEFAASGVRANALALGPFRTAMLDSMRDFDEVERAKGIPMGRLGEPDDVVGPALFLLGGASRYVTGQVLHVNGGFTIR